MYINAPETALLRNFYDTQPELTDLITDFNLFATEAYPPMPRPRFGMHDTDGTLDNLLFIDAVGIDASHQLHPIKQATVLDSMLTPAFKFKNELEYDDLMLAATLHDTGEPGSKSGDTLPWEAKDADHETTMRHTAIRAIAPDRAEEIIDRIEPILSDRFSKLGRIFSLSERVGYIATGSKMAGLFMRKAGCLPFELNPAQRLTLGLAAVAVNKGIKFSAWELLTGLTVIRPEFDQHINLLRLADTTIARRHPKLHAAKLATIK